MPLEDAIDFIESIEEAERDELIMKRWIPIQFEMSLADFKARLLTPRKTVKETLADVESILIAFHNQKGGV
ncbi:MAG: hypothetical protein ACI4DY_09075 [Monoglobaceae bacterium]